MRILLEFTVLTYKMWHNIAVRLNELYPNSQFAAICSIGKENDQVLKFLQNQKEIKYEFIALSYEIVENALKSPVDIQSLTKFEERSFCKSIWRMVCADRTLVTAFMHGCAWPDHKIAMRANKDKEFVLGFFSGILRRNQEIFDRFKPTLYLPSPASGDIAMYIKEQLAIDYGAINATPATCRIEDIFAFTSSCRAKFPSIDKLYLQFLNNSQQQDLSSGEKLYNSLVSTFSDNNFFDRKNKVFSIKLLRNPKDRFLYFIRIFGILAFSIYSWIVKITARYSNSYSQLNNLLGFSQYLNMQYLRWHHNFFHLLNPRFGSIVPKEQKYIYFPLHMVPEYSTQIQGTMWLDQIHLIEALAKSIPCDWVVYVKEHPATLRYRSRPLNFYSQILKFPNVRIAPIDSDMHEIINNAKMVAVITGTSGWEAMLRGVPVLTFGDCMWDILELSKKITDLSNLSNEINDEVKRCKTISDVERKKRLVSYLEAVLKAGFRMTCVQQYSFNLPGNDEHFKKIGFEIADGLAKHIEILD